MKVLICLVFCCMCSLVTWCQKDTIRFYLDSGRFKCTKDTAVYLVKQYKQGGKWIQENYSLSAGSLNTISSFSDKACSLLQGITISYSGEGTKTSSTDFDNGSALSKTFFYKSGAKKAFMSFDYNIIRSWDENGTELNNVILEKDAKPAGFSWIGYLRDSINGSVAANSKLPIGFYQVNARFIVDTLGNLTHVRTFFDKCAKCAEEAARVIRKSPQWEPAVKNNLRIPFETEKIVYFIVSNKQVGRAAVTYSILRKITQIIPH